MSRFAFIAALLIASFISSPALAQSQTPSWFHSVILENDFNPHELGTMVLHNQDEDLTISYRLTRGDDWQLYVLKNPELCQWVAQYRLGDAGLRRDEACDLYMAAQISYYEYQHDLLDNAVMSWVNSRRDLHDDGATLFRVHDTPDPEFFAPEEAQRRREQAAQDTGTVFVKAEVFTTFSCRMEGEQPTTISLRQGEFIRQELSPGIWTYQTESHTRDVMVKSGKVVKITFLEEGFISLLDTHDTDDDSVDTAPERTFFGEVRDLVLPEINPFEPGRFVAGPIFGYRHTKGWYSVVPASPYPSKQNMGLMGVELALNRYRFQVAGFGGFDIAMPQRPLFAGYQFQGGLDLTYARLSYGWLREWQGLDAHHPARYIHDGRFWSIDVSPWSIPENLRWTEIFRVGYSSCHGYGWMPVYGGKVAWREIQYPMWYLQVNIASRPLFDQM